MSSPGQRRGKCGHVMANFDTHSHCARCKDKGKGKEPCVSDPQTSDCQICNSLTSEQLQQLSTPSYKIKKEKREAKLPDSTPSQDSEQLVDPSSVSVFGVVDGQGSVKSPAPVPPPDKKPKKDNKNSKKEKSPSTKMSKHSTDEKFAEIDSKWSEHFSRLEALIMAKSFDPTLQPTFTLQEKLILTGLTLTVLLPTGHCHLNRLTPVPLLFTGLGVIASPVCHLRPVACRITHHWIYILRKGSYLRTRISLYRNRTNQFQKSRIIGILCRAGHTFQNWTIQLPLQMITLLQGPRL